MKTIKDKFIGVTVLWLLFLIITGSTNAYYLDHKQLFNEFKTGGVKVSLNEKKYNLKENAEKRSHISPREEIIKDPEVTNIGESDCYVFIKVSNPIKNFTRLDTDGRKMSDKPLNQTFFEYSINPEWKLIENPKEGVDIYAYVHEQGTEVSMSVLKKNETTPPLFTGEKIRAANFIEKEMDSGEFVNIEMPVRTYALQTSDLKNNNCEKISDPFEIWCMISERGNYYNSCKDIL